MWHAAVDGSLSHRHKIWAVEGSIPTEVDLVRKGSAIGLGCEQRCTPYALSDAVPVSVGGDICVQGRDADRMWICATGSLVVLQFMDPNTALKQVRMETET